MPVALFDRLLQEEVALRRELHQSRFRTLFTPIDSTHVLVGGRSCINFASNSYLGLAQHPRVIEAMCVAARRAGAGSGASALITGYTDEHASTESALAKWKSTESAVLLPSGYQAAHALIQTLARLGGKTPPRFLIDKLCHASLIDGLGSAGAAFRVFPHNNMGKLRRLLAEAPADQLQVVVTESIFSMDGDSADLRSLAELKAEHPFVLVLDEAHGSGVYGANGSGYAAEQKLNRIVDVSLITLSKAIGVAGGAICASKLFCDGVVNWARAYIYSTATPPAIAAAIRAAIDVMRDEPQRQTRVRDLARHVRQALDRAGLRIPAGNSPIIPIILGSEEAALCAAERLREEGMLVMPIRPPTVPRGSSRLRITLSCDHTDSEVEQLIAKIRPEAGS